MIFLVELSVKGGRGPNNAELTFVQKGYLLFLVSFSDFKNEREEIEFDFLNWFPGIRTKVEHSVKAAGGGGGRGSDP